MPRSQRLSTPARDLDVTDRIRTLAACLFVVAITFAQSAGEIVGDTKLDLSVDPYRFLERSLHLWDPTAGFGQLQDQAYGYLWPMGPFFALGHLLRIPAWEIQRLWQSALLITALLGVRALAKRLDIGTPNTRLFGGLAFALSPLILSEIGPLSSLAMTECIAPWVLVPLVGDRALARPRRAAALSGLAVFMAGGINASATLALLILPALWLITRPRHSGRLRLAAWWTVSVILACAWWAGPLVLLGKYSPPFLQWIESAATTTSTTNLFATLVGTENWVGHLDTISGPLWRAAWALAHDGFAVLDGGLAVALGLLGLLRRDLPHRRFLIAATLLGVTCTTFGHAATFGPIASGHEQSLLDGTLAAFRNIQKFDLVLRVPLAIALIHIITKVRLPSPAVLQRFTARPLYNPAAVLSVVAVLGLAVPVWSNLLEPRGGFDAIPSWWPQTASWLQDHDDGTRALLLPGSQHGDFTWGLPEDEPLQALATTEWDTRAAVPLGGAGEARLLDAVDTQVESGQGSTALAPYLARAGVGWLIVRSDLDETVENTTPPSVVLASLQQSPGIQLVQDFGGLQGDPGTGSQVSDGGTTVSVPAIEIFKVSDAAARVTTMPVATTLRVSGNVESLMQLEQSGQLSPTTATSLPAAGNAPAATTTQRRIVTDGNRRAEVNFGSAVHIYSPTLLPQAPWPVTRAAHDYEQADPAGHQTTAIVEGAATLLASSSASDTDAIRPLLGDHDAAQAFDGIPSTTWVSGGLYATGQWLQENFTSTRSPASIFVAAPTISGDGPPVDDVRVTTQAGSVIATVGAFATQIALPTGTTKWIRITAIGVEGGGRGAAASLEVAVSGQLGDQVSLQVPADGSALTGGAKSSVPQTFDFSALPEDEGCIEVIAPRRSICSTTLAYRTEDSAAIDRTFSTDRTAAYGVGIDVTAVGGAALDAATVTPDLKLAVSSRDVNAPADGTAAMTDDDSYTGWIASPSDADPTITATLPGTRNLTAIHISAADSLAASPPIAVRVASLAGGKVETARISTHGLAKLSEPLVGRRFTIKPVTPELRSNIGSGPGRLPIGVGELRLQFAHSTTAAVPDSDPFDLACGAGPQVVLDGQTYQTSVATSRGAILAGSNIPATLCALGPVKLTPATHRIRIATTSLLRPVSVTMTPTKLPKPPAVTDPEVTTLSWTANKRTVHIGNGASSWLVLAENFNVGWHATLNGKVLPAATIDGWRQAWQVPADDPGIVTMQFAPDHSYRLLLLIGAILAVLLMLLVALPVRREREVAISEETAYAGLLITVLSVVAVVAVSGPGAIFLPAAGLVAYLLRRRGIKPLQSLSFLAVFAIAVAAIATVSALHLTFTFVTTWRDTVAQAACAAALACLAVSMWLGSEQSDDS